MTASLPNDLLMKLRSCWLANPRMAAKATLKMFSAVRGLGLVVSVGLGPPAVRRANVGNEEPPRPADSGILIQHRIVRVRAYARRAVNDKGRLVNPVPPSARSSLTACSTRYSRLRIVLADRFRYCISIRGTGPCSSGGILLESVTRFCASTSSSVKTSM